MAWRATGHLDLAKKQGRHATNDASIMCSNGGAGYGVGSGYSGGRGGVSGGVEEIVAPPCESTDIGP